MRSDDREADFSLESPGMEEEEGVRDGGGESDTDDDVALPEINEEEDDPELNSPSVTTKDAVTVALPAGSAVPVSVIPQPKWHRMTEIVQRPPPPPPAIDDSRRLFQRLWIDEDEIELLRGFLDYVTTHRGGGGSNPPDTAPFYEQIKSKLQLDFNKNQLVEKLRRLKKKYRNVMIKIGSGKEVSFKSSHDQSTFEISRKIWNHTGKIIGFEDNNNVNDFDETNMNLEIDSENGVDKKVTMSSSGSRKRPRSRIAKTEEDNNKSDGQIPKVANNLNLNEAAGGIGDLGGLIEETVRNCVSPVIKEMMNGTTSMMMAAIGGSLSSPVFTRPFNFGYGVEDGGGKKAVAEERWRKQEILELEVYSRRLELVQEQIKATLFELKTMMPNGR